MADADPLAVRCPICGAPAGKTCPSANQKPHRLRVKYAAAIAGDPFLTGGEYPPLIPSSDDKETGDG